MAALHVNDADEFTIRILSDDINGLGVDDVDVDFSMKYNMKVDPVINDVIDRTWAKRHRENPLIFDGLKFRVHEMMSHESKRPLFRLGLTSYREFLGTNCSDQASILRARGQSEHENPQTYLADPLGVGAFVLTKDNKFVLLRRSHLCSEAQGLLDGPGGHAEPHMVSGLIGKPEVRTFTADVVDNPEVRTFTADLVDSSEVRTFTSGLVDSLEVRTFTSDLSDKPEVTISTREAIKIEIFDSILREIVDEVHISRCFLSEPKLLGVVYNHTTAWRCSLQFIVKCQLKSDEILKNFKVGGHLEANESTDCVFVDEQSAMEAPSSDWWSQLAPASKGAYAIYRQLKKTETKIK